jgi:hypothetical protein
MPRGLRFGFIKHLCSLRHSRRNERRILCMSSISVVAAPAPVKTPDASAPKAPDVKTGDATDAAASQPTVLAALPPGQGTRIDQIV